jgi:tetratricopeptide (TPR) repeat protein
MVKKSPQKGSTKNKQANDLKVVNPVSQQKNGRKWMAAILLLTFISFYPVINCGFTSWDDPLYVTSSNLIKSHSFDNIAKIFSTQSDVAANYHPLTILSLAFDYHITKLDPGFYHLVNLLLHLLNTLLVYLFIFRLTNGKLFVALFTALFFGIHPMHVESVAWVSERKDVLYTFFFLLSLLTYIRYVSSKKISFLVFTFLFFMASVLSKAMAVVLPVVLILIDRYQGNKFTIKSLLEKIPFFIVSIIFGIIALKIQSKESIASYETFSLFHRICFGFYGYFIYILKLFFPADLSSFYPYPTLGKEIAFPASVFIPSALGFLLFAFSVFLFLKNNKKLQTINFGLLFYFITVVLVLQFISVGQVIMADRYSYLSYIGLLLILGMLLDTYILNNPKKKNLVVALTGIVALIFSTLSHERINVWKNTETLWTDVIQKYPYPPWKIEIAYVGRGRYFAEEKKDLNSALADFNTLLSMETKNPAVYNNLGNIYGVKGQAFSNAKDTSGARQAFQQSLQYYSHALELDTTEASSTYVNRATAYIFMKDYRNAAEDFSKALQTDPRNSALIEKRAYANYMSGNWEKAIDDYNFLFSNQSVKQYMYEFRGTAYFNAGRYNEAVADLNVTIQNEPQNAKAYYLLSRCYEKLNNSSEAKINLEKAKSLGYQF